MAMIGYIAQGNWSGALYEVIGMVEDEEEFDPRSSTYDMESFEEEDLKRWAITKALGYYELARSINSNLAAMIMTNNLLLIIGALKLDLNEIIQDARTYKKRA